MSTLEQTLHFLHAHRNIVFVLLTLALMVLAFMSFNHAEAPEQTEKVAETNITISLTIGDSYNNESLIVSENETLLDVLKKIDESDPDMQLAIEEYEGLGALITSMYGYENGTENRYWQYEIHDVMPQIGAGAYALQSNDAIYWKFTESTY